MSLPDNTLPSGAVLVVLITLFDPISGAHAMFDVPGFILAETLDALLVLLIAGWLLAESSSSQPLECIP